MANKVLIEVHGSLVILKMLQIGPVRSGVVLQVVRCGQVRSGVAGAVNSQTGFQLHHFATLLQISPDWNKISSTGKRRCNYDHSHTVRVRHS